MGTGRTDEFRKDAVRIALTSGLSRRQVADDLGGCVANAVEIPWRRAPDMWRLGFSGGEVKRHRFDGLRESFPAIDLAHLDLAGSQQRPEQHRHGFGAGQHGLGLDAAAEFLVETFDGVGGSGTPAATRARLKAAGWLYDPVAALWHLPDDPALWEATERLLASLVPYPHIALAKPLPDAPRAS